MRKPFVARVYQVRPPGAQTDTATLAFVLAAARVRPVAFTYEGRLFMLDVLGGRRGDADQA